jgi:hypothetical protein
MVWTLSTASHYLCFFETRSSTCCIPRLDSLGGIESADPPYGLTLSRAQTQQGLGETRSAEGSFHTSLHEFYVSAMIQLSGGVFACETYLQRAAAALVCNATERWQGI